MAKRINILLPEKTVAILDRVTKPGKRSRFIDQAILHYIATQGKKNLRERLKEEAIANAERDLEIAAEWFPLEEEAFEISEKAAASAGKRGRRQKLA
jgi:CopG family transcriptional regulator / antitoxin EndoAI